jgi:hypothetical protein
MSNKCWLLLLVAVGLLGGAGLSSAEEKKDKKEAVRKGTVVGTLTDKSDKWIEVKADGEEKARRYVPHWRGGAPSAGGGPDKKTLELIGKLKKGSRVRLEWSFAERLRIDKVEVLKAPEEKKDKTEK